VSLDCAALDRRYRSHLRLVEAAPADAAYICALRSDPALNRHLSRSAPDPDAQLRWLERYKAREQAGEEYYFVIVSDGADHGVVRLYDFREIEGRRSFCWGSWIIPRPRPSGLVVYSALLVYEVGFDGLGFDQAHFDVRRGNRGVIDFHERAGARRIGEDEQDVFFWFFPQDHRRMRAANAAQVAEHRVLAGS